MIDEFVMAINESLVERGALLDDCQLCVRLGEAADNENGDYPRMVIFPTSDAFDSAWNPGGNQRPVKSVATGLELHIWGENISKTEEMRDQFVLAMHMKAYGNYTLQSGSWDRESLLTTRGRRYVLRFIVMAPIADIKLKTSPINSKNTTFKIDVAEQFPSGPQGNVEIKVPKPTA